MPLCSTDIAPPCTRVQAARGLGEHVEVGCGRSPRRCRARALSSIDAREAVRVDDCRRCDLPASARRHAGRGLITTGQLIVTLVSYTCCLLSSITHRLALGSFRNPMGGVCLQSPSARAHVLADGRELIYFDDADTTLRARAEARHCATLDPRPETANDASRRSADGRMGLDRGVTAEPRVPPAGRAQDPLAPASPTNPSEIPDIYDVAVFENRSPSFGPLLAPDAPNAPHERSTHLADDRLRPHPRPRSAAARSSASAPRRTGSFASLTRITRPYRRSKPGRERTEAL